MLIAKKMSVSTFGTFIKLIKVQCTKTWVSPRDRGLITIICYIKMTVKYNYLRLYPTLCLSLHYPPPTPLTMRGANLKVCSARATRLGIPCKTLDQTRPAHGGRLRTCEMG